MYPLTRMLTMRQLLVEQLPALGASLLIAELFYKFHSFTLEAMAFLGTWYVIGGVLNVLSTLGSRRPGGS